MTRAVFEGQNLEDVVAAFVNMRTARLPLRSCSVEPPAQFRPQAELYILLAHGGGQAARFPVLRGPLELTRF